MRITGVCNIEPPPRRNFHDDVEVLCHRSEAELLNARHAAEAV